ncbi:MAG: LuxR C-terminal-related transcriptional regulator, partial [Jatrophihabitans sp.]|uniref:LuxR C-terminal-related transcriptional regulator n=1 Tax=Jatrophihabitans sp. TaxID=1932789 RepID=UPI003F817797
ATAAASLGAPRAAVEWLRLALRARPTDGPVRRGLYEALSYECYLTDQLDEAITARRQALELAVLDGDARAVGVAQRWLSRLLWFTGRNADSRRFAELAVETLEPLGADAELAMAYSNVAQLAMLRDDTIAAVRWGRRALAMARELGAVNVEMHAANNVGTALAYSTGPHEGRDLLHRSLELAVRHDQHEHAARAYTNLGSVAYMTRHHAEAERVLTAGITYCTERDLDSWRLYMTASLATSLVEQGRLDEAATAAATVLTAPHLSTISFIGAAPAAALADLRRGRDPGDLLERAARSAAGTGESQRLAPIASALAEAAWLAGTEIVADTFEAAWATTLARPDPWRLGELAWWRHVAGLPAAPQLPPIAAPFAALLTAPPREAAERWLASNCPFWAAHALNRSDDLDDARRAVELVEACGATAVADALRRDRRARGQAVPRGPRATTRDHPAALTAREVDVLRPLVDGRSNAEIGAALFLSEKTVAHHVSAVLRKLDEPTRARAAAAAVARELI